MRKLLSILLLAIFALPLLLAFSGAGSNAESRLAACCRRTGAHHCAMSAEATAELENGPIFRESQKRCPLFPGALASAHAPTVLLDASAAVVAALSSYPAGSRQVAAWARVARDSDCRKRGPPRCPLS